MLDRASVVLSYATNKYLAQINTTFKYWNSVEQNGTVQQNNLFLVIPSTRTSTEELYGPSVREHSN